MEIAFYYFFIFVLGTLFGSFLNVVIYRLPRNESIIFPASHCTSCHKGIKFYDNIPIISYLFLQGRCRYCGASISYQYPLVELVTGLLFLLVIAVKGIGWFSVFELTLVSALIAVYWIDYKHYIIPDLITLPGIGVGLLYSFLKGEILSSILGMAGGFLFFYAIAGLSLLIYKKEGMGGGDIKLSAMLGAWLGWQSLIVSLFIAFWIGAIAGLLLIKFLKDRMFPFGTALSLGGVVGFLWGDRLISWYLGLL